jgi:hypothetical protein
VHPDRGRAEVEPCLICGSFGGPGLTTLLIGTRLCICQFYLSVKPASLELYSYTRFEKRHLLQFHIISAQLSRPCLKQHYLPNTTMLARHSLQLTAYAPCRLLMPQSQHPTFQRRIVAGAGALPCVRNETRINHLNIAISYTTSRSAARMSKLGRREILDEIQPCGLKQLTHQAHRTLQQSNL